MSALIKGRAQLIPSITCMVAISACALTPPDEYQAYPGERRSAEAHAAILSNDVAFVTHVDLQQTGSLLSGGFPSTVYLDAGVRRVHLYNSMTRDSVILCFRASNGDVYAVMGTARPMASSGPELWLRDNRRDEETGYVVGMTEECDPARL